MIHAAAADWLISQMDAKVEIENMEPLKGGISSSMTRVSLGKKTDVVLRQFINKEWLENEPDLAVHEAANLKLAEHHGLDAPKLIAYDPDGDLSGHPSVLMSYIEGKAVLEPADMNRWIDQMALALAQIHMVKADTHPWKYRSYTDLKTVTSFEWSDSRELWKKALEIASGPRPAGGTCLIHRDYHPTNILWRHDGTLAGVVDWVNACVGPPGADVGHCRLNLVSLHGLKIADQFLDAYKKHNPDFRYDPYWDIVSILDWLPGPFDVYPGWTDLGFKGLTTELVTGRIEGLLHSVIENY